MRVQELMKLLQGCDPNATIMCTMHGTQKMGHVIELADPEKTLSLPPINAGKGRKPEPHVFLCIGW